MWVIIDMSLISIVVAKCILLIVYLLRFVGMLLKNYDDDDYDLHCGWKF